MKKLLFVVTLSLIIFLVLGVLIIGMNTDLGTTSAIEVPDGFNITKTTKDSIVLSNGKSNFTIREAADKSIESIIEDYKKKHENDTVEVSSFDVDGVEVIGLNLKVNHTYVHTNYYYEKNGRVYHIYPDGDYDMTILKGLVKSTNKRLF